MARYFFDKIQEKANSIFSRKNDLKIEQYVSELEDFFKEIYTFFNSNTDARLSTVASIELMNLLDSGIKIVNDDCKIVSINKKYESVFGIDASQFIGKKCSSLPHHKGKHCACCPVKNEDCRERFFEEEIILSENKKWIQHKVIALKETEIGISGFIEVTDDISERKNREQELIEIKTRYENAIEASNEGIWENHIPSGTIHYSKRWFSMLGYEADEFPNTISTYRKLCHAKDLTRSTIEISKTLLSGKDSYEVDVRLKAKSGEWRWIRIKGKVVEKNSFGLPVRIVGTNTDIHDVKTHQEALSESESRFRLLAESSSEGIMVSNMGFITDVNDQLVEMLGFYSKSELLEKSIMSLFTDEFRDYMTYIFSSNSIEKKVHIYLVSKNGSLVPVEMSSRPFNYKEKPHRVFTFNDISERIHAEQMRIDEEERFKMLSDAAFEAVIISENGSIIDFNKQILRIFGSDDRSQLIGHSLLEFISPGQRELVKQKLIEDITQSYVLELIIPNKGTLIAEVTGRNFRYKGRMLRVTSLRDITEKIKIEESLKESEERYRTLFENTIIPYLVTSVSGKAVAANQAFFKRSGHTLEKLNEMGVENFYAYPEERELFISKMTTEGKVTEFPLSLVVKEGIVDTIVNSSLITIGSDKYIFSSYLEITNEKKLQHAISKASIDILGKSQESILKQLLKVLCELLRADAAIVAEYSADNQLDVIGGIINGNEMESLMIPVCDIPCEEVIKGKDVIVVKDVSLRYAGTALLNMHLEGYIGVPLIFNNQIIGVLAVYFVKPLYDIEYKKSVMHLFSVRAAAEVMQKRNEKALRNSEELYRSTIANSPLGFVLSDTDGVMLMVNENFCEFVGYSREELLGTTFEHFTHPDYIEKDWSYIRQLISGKISTYNLEKIYIRKNGSEMWVNLTVSLIKNTEGKPLFLNGIIENISHRKRIEQEIITSRNRYQSLFDSSPIAIFEMDFSEAKRFVDRMGTNTFSNITNFIAEHTYLLFVKPKVKILSLNKSTMELFAVKSLKEFNDYMLKQANEHSLKAMATLCSKFVEGETVVSFEQSATDANGKPLQLSVQYALPKGTEESWSRVIVTCVDIVHHLETERKMLNIIVETEERERSRFARDLHDDLGPFLSGIKLYVNELTQPLLDNAKREELSGYLLQMIDESIARTRYIAHELMPNVLLDFGLEKALSSFCNKINGTGKLEVELNCTKKKMKLNKTLEIIIYRVVIELINNTIRHAHARNVTIDLKENRNNLMLKYKDDGKGFEVGIIRENSSGLGLKNMEHRLKSIGGQIVFNSTPGEGMSAVIAIPIQ